MHGERSLALHCIEQHACTANDLASSRMHDDRANADATICKHASSTMHDVATIRMHTDRVQGCKMHADRTIASMQRVRCIRRQRVHDLERAIKTKPKDKDLRVKPDAEVIIHRASCILTSHSGVVQYVTLRRVGHSAHIHIRVLVQFIPTSRVSEWMHPRLGMYGVHLRVRPLSNRTGVMTRVLEGNLQLEP